MPFNSSWGHTLYAAEGVDIYLTWGQAAATTTMQRTLPDEAIAVGDALRTSLVQFARTATLGSASESRLWGDSQWEAYPAVCEVGEQLQCSTQNAHARACAIFDRGFGRKYDCEMG